MTMPSQESVATNPPRLIGLDWGTTSLRAILIGETGAVIAQQSKAWGITQLPPGGFPAAFDAMTAAWRQAFPAVPCLAAGMVGSRQGWVEAPYCQTPATIEALAANIVTAPGGTLRIVPGVARTGPQPDFMRGEETQIFGAATAAGRHCVVLPGTHCKWVEVVDGRIQDFQTFMTGDVFAALRGGTILGAFPQGAEEDHAAFARGVTTAFHAQGGIAGLLFSARAQVLAGALAPSGAVNYLSGLLIGDELRAAPKDAQPLLIGNAALCRRYQQAMQLCGIKAALGPELAVAAGLLRIARHEGNA